jgi:hypothetical protein
MLYWDQVSGSKGLLEDQIPFPLLVLSLTSRYATACTSSSSELDILRQSPPRKVHSQVHVVEVGMEDHRSPEVHF